MFKIFTPYVMNESISWQECQKFMEENGIYSYQALKQSSLILNTNALLRYEEELRNFMYQAALRDAKKFYSIVISSRPIFPESESLIQHLKENGIRYFYCAGKHSQQGESYIWFEKKETVNFPETLDPLKLSSYRSFLKKNIKRHMKNSLNNEVTIFPAISSPEYDKPEHMKIHLRGNCNIDAMITGHIPLNFRSNYISALYYSEFLNHLGRIINLSTYPINHTEYLFAAYHLSRYIGWEHFVNYILEHISNAYDQRVKQLLAEKGCITVETKNDMWRLAFQDLTNPFFLLFEGKFKSIFYRKTLKAALKHGPDYIYQLSQQIEQIYEQFTHPAERENTIIRLGKAVRNNLSLLDLKNFTALIKKEKEYEWLQTNGFTSPKAEEFLLRVKKYVNDADFKYIAQCYSLETLKAFVEGTTPDFFVSQTFNVNYYPTLGEVIQKAVGKRGNGAQVKNAGKLFSRLSKLGNVKHFIQGDIPCTCVPEIVTLLKEYRMEVPERAYKSQEISGIIEKKGSPEFLVAGNASVCCMPLGQSNAVSYAHEHGYGLLNVYYHGRIIANSVLWINEYQYGRTLVIDNIEVAPNYIHLNPYIRCLYLSLIPDLCKQYNCLLAAQGAAYSDLDLPNLFITPGNIRSVDARLPEWELYPVSITHADTSYTDAHSAYPIWFASPMIFERILLDLKKQLKIPVQNSSNIINQAAIR